MAADEETRPTISCMKLAASNSSSAHRRRAVTHHHHPSTSPITRRQSLNAGTGEPAIRGPKRL
ncbi:hypothetical protein ACHAXT_004096 [Thalassiosira profunda]